jgi:hypothetical protein
MVQWPQYLFQDFGSPTMAELSVVAQQQYPEVERSQVLLI